jgi:hypothetical protein
LYLDPIPQVASIFYHGPYFLHEEFPVFGVHSLHILVMREGTLQFAMTLDHSGDRDSSKMWDFLIKEFPLRPLSDACKQCQKPAHRTLELVNLLGENLRP